MKQLIQDLKQCLYCWVLSKKGQRLSDKVSIQKMEEPIDFVVTWVDGNDPEWRSRKEEYERKIGIFREHKDNGEERYRDWDIFNYWFRAVETYAPWVRNVYLITSGQIPEWLNLDAPKLKLINHIDYIPKEHLPTFNSNVIELNMHRIEGLGEHFVYFNDDMFLARPCRPEDFFSGGEPNYSAVAMPLRNRDNGAFSHINFTVIGAINSIFGGKLGEIAARYPEKWFSRQYGENLFFNKSAVQQESLPGLYFSHVAVPFRKQTFFDVWKTFPNLLMETSSHRFRTPQDVFHQLISAWDIMNGNFNPVSMEHSGKMFWHPLKENAEILEAIRGKKHLCICINDSEYVTYEDFMTAKQSIAEEMEKAFPQKSSFEK